MEVGEHLGETDQNIMCAKILLRVGVQDCRGSLLDFRNANFEGTRRELGDGDWETLTTGQSAFGKWETLKDKMCLSAE